MSEQPDFVFYNRNETKSANFCFDFQSIDIWQTNLQVKEKKSNNHFAINMDAISNNLVQLKINKVRPKINQLMNKYNNLV